jgi:hypothetical protein
MTPGYDASACTVLPVDALGQRTNMTYDTGLHPTPVAASPPAAGATDATGPILWVIDPLGNRVELLPPMLPSPPPDSDGDEPVVVIRPE